ncbi:hypothetical protein AMS62_03190 [Bacillus sp. FJAT-18019]|nr:hypothetical protein AMS62_03190 [Bacillus sp. FJAT-18019]
MNNEYFPPTYKSTSFHCPYCGVKSSQMWCNTTVTVYASSQANSDLKLCLCDHCREFSYWYKEKMIIPVSTMAPLPHPDTPESLLGDFQEARSIVHISPRGSAALLRLALQKLMIELGESGKDINKDIGSLVQKGLPEEVQQALDIVRVIGNESVHPGELDLRDDQETALHLFELINFIIEERISRKKRIASLFSQLPEGKRKGIEDRDKPKTVHT